jgi:hypothetical protein
MCSAFNAITRAVCPDRDVVSSALGSHNEEKVGGLLPIAPHHAHAFAVDKALGNSRVLN